MLFATGVYLRDITSLFFVLSNFALDCEASERLLFVLTPHLVVRPIFSPQLSHPHAHPLPFLSYAYLPLPLLARMPLLPASVETTALPV